MCLLCHLRTATPEVCPIDGMKNTAANSFAELREALQNTDPAVTEIKTLSWTEVMQTPNSGLATTQNVITYLQSVLNGKPLPPPAPPAVDPNPQGQQSAPNLSGPLRSIDWGWQVADQLPDTPAHDIRVYFVPGSVQVQSQYDTVTTSSWSAAERAAAMEVFAQYEAVADVNFIQTNRLSEADFVMVEYDGGAYGALGYFELSDSTITVNGTRVNVNGLGVFNNDAPGWNNAGLAQGGYGHLTLVHEIGHGMGLAHPHDTGGSSTVMAGVTRTYDDLGTSGLNQTVYTMMSYNDGWVSGPAGTSNSASYGYVGGPMALDIAVLQDTYGANTTTASGNTTYTLPDANRAGTFYTAIWDTGGTDQITAGGTNRDVVIDLRAATLVEGPAATAGGGGFVSYASGIHGGVTIANGVVIENAIGGGGNDRITGNDSNNVLRGNGGNDVIQSLGGTDQLYGGSGADRFVFIPQGEGSTGQPNGPIGANTIHDFEDNVDRLEFHHPTRAAVQQGNDVLFDFGNGNSVLVLDITTGAISDDVIFV